MGYREYVRAAVATACCLRLACLHWGLACLLACLSCVSATGARWKIVLYSDGFTPGVALVPDNQRKSIAWYLSFMELGKLLSYEEAWLPVAFARTAGSAATI